MEILYYIAIYFAIGSPIYLLYRVRDIKKSCEVDNFVFEIVGNDPKGFGNVELDMLFHVGYWFWRRKWPFVEWKEHLQELFGLMFWPLDLIMCEIGYAKEMSYLRKRNKILKGD